jgi:hypothetical protein
LHAAKLLRLELRSWSGTIKALSSASTTRRPEEQPAEVKVLDALGLHAIDDFFAYPPSFLGGAFVGA